MKFMLMLIGFVLIPGIGAFGFADPSQYTGGHPAENPDCIEYKAPNVATTTYPNCTMISPSGPCTRTFRFWRCQKEGHGESPFYMITIACECWVVVGSGQLKRAVFHLEIASSPKQLARVLFDNYDMLDYQSISDLVSYLMSQDDSALGEEAASKLQCFLLTLESANNNDKNQDEKIIREALKACSG